MAEMSRDNAHKVDGYWGTIDKAVEYLIDCRNKGESVCIDFNGKTLYSADVTMEGAYLQITGLTQEESNNARDEMVAAKTAEQKDEVIKKYNELKQGHIDEQKKNAKQVEGYWGTIDKAVEYLTDCRNKGESVCIDFNGKTLYSADVTMDDAYLQITGLTREESNNSFIEMVDAKTEEQRSAVRRKYDELKQRHIDEQNKNEKQVKGDWKTIDEAVEYLIDCRNKGESICIDFNGQKLYSDDVTMESAYLQITGLTREESNNSFIEMVDAKTEEQRSAVRKKYDELKQRHIDEKSIIQHQKEKEQLTYEISDTELQIDALRAKEAELKELDENQINDLEDI